MSASAPIRSVSFVTALRPYAESSVGAPAAVDRCDGRAALRAAGAGTVHFGQGEHLPVAAGQRDHRRGGSGHRARWQRKDVGVSAERGPSSPSRSMVRAMEAWAELSATS